MELKGGLYFDKETNEIKFKRSINKNGIFWILFSMLKIILTKQEAKERGLDLKKNPKGFYVVIEGIKVPVNIVP